MPKPTLFGQRVARARNLRRFTQEQLAQKSGVPAAVISHFETGVRSSASADNLVKLADALRVSVDYLLGRTDDMAAGSGDLERRAAQLSDENWEVLESVMQTLSRSARPASDKKK
jgi:transcriptional regulator with XRE-family HTH domain